jgi:hypothetical protein
MTECVLNGGNQLATFNEAAYKMFNEALLDVTKNMEFLN